MIPVDQDTFGAWGNCLSACVASILELPLKEVPLFHDLNEPYVPQVLRLTSWLRPLGLRASEGSMPVIPIEDLFELDAYLPGDFYILCGLSPRRPHVVVARGGFIVHDPHPSRAGLVNADGFMVIGLR